MLLCVAGFHQQGVDPHRLLLLRYARYWHGLVAATGLAWLAAAIRGWWERYSEHGRDVLILVSVALVPVAWTFLLPRHTYIHAPFMVRMLVVPISLAPLALCWPAGRGSRYSAQKNRGFHLPRSHLADPTRLARLEFAILSILFFLAVLDFNNGYRMHGGFLLAHGRALLYAIKTFLGFQYAFQDIAILWQRQEQVLSSWHGAARDDDTCEPDLPGH